jgi:hypothetical protein
VKLAAGREALTQQTAQRRDETQTDDRPKHLEAPGQFTCGFPAPQLLLFAQGKCQAAPIETGFSQDDQAALDFSDTAALISKA